MTCTCPTCGSPIAPTGILVSLNDNTVTTPKGSVRLQRRLAQMAAILAGSPGFISTDRLGYAPDDTDIVRVYVCRLRKSLALIGIKIETVTGCGYRMVLVGEGQQ